MLYDEKKYVLVILLALFGAGLLPILHVQAGNMKDEHMKKLDPFLQRIVTGQSVPTSLIDTHVDNDGIRWYGVIIRTSNPEELHTLEIRIGSIVGNLVTARVTREQIIPIAQLGSVSYIEISTIAEPMRRQ